MLVDEKSISAAYGLIQQIYTELSKIRDQDSQEFKEKVRKQSDLKEYIALAKDNTMKGQDEFFREERLKILADKLQL